MNKKGFTTIELIISFMMVSIMLASLIGFTINYRDKVKQEEVRSQLYDFKNTITKIVYDDIITQRYVNMSLCVGVDNCVNFVDESGKSHTLKIENSCEDFNCDIRPCELKKCGVYLIYNNKRYLLPDSDLNKYYKESDSADSPISVIESACNLSSFSLKTYENSLYNLKISFSHYAIKDNIDIMLTIN